MKFGFVRYNQLLIVYATIYHVVWGLLLIVNGGTLNFTGAGVIAGLFHNYRILAVALIGVGLIALGGTPLLPKKYVVLRLACLIPQQIVLWTSAIAVLEAVAFGHFADGEIRPWQFILIDQMQTLLIALLYTIAVMEPAIFTLQTKWRLAHEPLEQRD